VAARDFDVLSFGSWAGGELWRPYPVTPDLRGLSVLGKLRSGVTIDQANQELAAIGTSLEQDLEESRFALRAMPAQSETPGSTKRALLLMMGAVSVVLLIACANVASLLLIRAAAREREIGVRIALGAGRGRLARQMLTESLMLALLGGAAGLLVAWYGLQLLVAARPDSLTALSTVRLEPAVLGWCLTISILCGVVFGLAPMMVGAHRVDLLKGTRTVSGTVRSHRTRSALVTLEVALSVTLLVGAGLLVRSVHSMQQQDLGFEPAGILSIGVSLPEDRYASREARVGAFDRILAEIGRIPGIGAYTIAAGVPPSAGITFGALHVEGRPAEAEAPVMVGFNMVSADYFRMLAIDFREGSTFGPDTAGAAIISETMARRLWPGESAIGRRFRVGDRGPFNTVVGIVGDLRSPGRERATHELQMYRPFSSSWHDARIVVRPTGSTEHLLGQVMRVVASIDPTIKVRDAETIEASLAKGIAAERFSMRLLGGFAALALVLSAVGLYGVIAYGVAQRTRELGMRIALGAMPRDVLAMVVRQGLRISMVGVALGLVSAAVATRAMESFLFEVDRLDPVTYAGVAGAILTVAMLATWLPARNAASVDPIAALRTD
jgi:predicted permease